MARCGSLLSKVEEEVMRKLVLAAAVFLCACSKSEVGPAPTASAPRVEVKSTVPGLTREQAAELIRKDRGYPKKDVAEFLLLERQTLTPEEAKYVLEKKPKLGGLFLKVVTCVVDLEVTGIATGEGEKSATVKWATKASEVTPFAKWGDCSAANVRETHFQLYDDGWRIEE